MFANNTVETGTGAGNEIFLIAPVTFTNEAGQQETTLPFLASFADGDLVSYFIKDAAGIIQAAGIGTYNATNNSIIRNDTWNYNGTVVDKNPATNIALSAGTHTVRCDVASSQIATVRSNTVNASASSRYVYDMWDAASRKTRTGLAGRGWLVPYCVPSRVTISGLGVELVSLATSQGVMRLGLYTMDYDTNIATLVDTTAVIDSSVTGTLGFNTALFEGGDITLFPHTPYFLMMGSDGNASTKGGVSRHPFMVQRYSGTGSGAYINGGFSGGSLMVTTPVLDYNRVQSVSGYPRLFGVLA